MNEIFTFVKNSTYNLRSGMHLSRVNVHSTQYCTESIGNLGAKIQNLVPVHVKDLKALSTFRNQIKKWKLSVQSVQSICSTSWLFVEATEIFCFLQWNPILLVLFSQFLFYSIIYLFIYLFIRFIIIFMLFMYFYFYSCIHFF